ncbi:xanthine dehydrogenase accessory protein XdhC [Enterobacterales bacterium CwR94]|nr:xanthine dehydrogenase accessory protein XdhC [Enterobacterales bacterium CwR94]
MQSDNWIGVLAALQAQREPCILLTVMHHRGSVPRGAGTKMVVTEQAQYLTIGGGHLEYQSIAQARAMLAAQATEPHTETFPLGARLGQCCGGMAQVLFEPVIQQQPRIAVFGAGHVGKALVTVLSSLPCHVYWVDERAELLQEAPPGVTLCKVDDPTEQVVNMPADSYYVVMTHDHAQDLLLTEAILKRCDARYVGLIGSMTKWQRFAYRLAGKGFSTAQLDRVRCPVGLPDVKGKLPAEIAIAIAAEIITVYQQQNRPQSAAMTSDV